MISYSIDNKISASIVDRIAFPINKDSGLISAKQSIESASAVISSVFCISKLAKSAESLDDRDYMRDDNRNKPQSDAVREMVNNIDPNAPKPDETFMQKFFGVIKAIWSKIIAWAKSFKDTFLKWMRNAAEFFAKIFNGPILKKKSEVLIDKLKMSKEDVVPDINANLASATQKFVDDFKGTPYVDDVTIKCVAKTKEALMEYMTDFTDYSFIPKIRSVIQYQENLPAKISDDIKTNAFGFDVKDDKSSFVYRICLINDGIRCWYNMVSKSYDDDGRLSCKGEIQIPTIEKISDILKAAQQVQNGNYEKFSAMLTSSTSSVKQFTDDIEDLNAIIAMIDRSPRSVLPQSSVAILNCFSSLFTDTCTTINMYGNGAMLLLQAMARITQFINAAVVLKIAA